MAKKKPKKPTTDETGEEEIEDESGDGGKLKLIIAGVVLVVVGAVLGSKMLGGGAAPASALGPTTTTTEPAGPVTSLDTITLNLADGRFLKVGLAFEIHHDETYPEGDFADETTKGFAREIDVSIGILSSYTFDELVAPDGKARAKARLLEAVVPISDGAIRNVLFHEFVMQ